jgi:hypothetical protein
MYGIGYIEGYIAQDQIALFPDFDKRAGDRIPFLSVHYASGLEGLVSDGLLGLAPAPSPGTT